MSIFLRVRKVKLREGKRPAKGHTAVRGWGILCPCPALGSEMAQGRGSCPSEKGEAGGPPAHGVPHSHPTLVLSQVAWAEEKRQTLAMKTLRARFKKTEVSLRPLRCSVPPIFRPLCLRAWPRSPWAFGALSSAPHPILLAASVGTRPPPSPFGTLLTTHRFKSPPLASVPSPPFPVYCPLVSSCPHCFLFSFQPLLFPPPGSPLLHRCLSDPPRPPPCLASVTLFFVPKNLQ